MSICKIKLDTYLITYTKLYSSRLTQNLNINLNIRVKIFKLVEENIDDFGLSSGFLDMTPKIQSVVKTDKLDFVQNFYASKDTIEEVKNYPQNGRKHSQI